jgi:hypothetical protein
VSPSDEDIYNYVSATYATVWQMKYNTGSGSASKWETIGGCPAFGEPYSSSLIESDGRSRNPGRGSRQ